MCVHSSARVRTRSMPPMYHCNEHDLLRICVPPLKAQWYYKETLMNRITDVDRLSSDGLELDSRPNE
jgi:hypothetical protein